jgi:hypothetical protein
MRPCLRSRRLLRLVWCHNDPGGAGVADAEVSGSTTPENLLGVVALAQRCDSVGARRGIRERWRRASRYAPRSRDGQTCSAHMETTKTESARFWLIHWGIVEGVSSISIAYGPEGHQLAVARCELVQHGEGVLYLLPRSERGEEKRQVT